MSYFGAFVQSISSRKHTRVRANHPHAFRFRRRSALWSQCDSRSAERFETRTVKIVLKQMKRPRRGGAAQGGSMPDSRIEFLSRGRRRSLFDAVELRSSDHPWAGYFFEESEGNGEPLACHSWDKTTLLYVCKGGSSLQWKHRGVWQHDPLEHGTVSIVRRDVEIQAAVPSGRIPMLVIQLDNGKFMDLAPRQIRSIDQALVPVQVAQDPQLANLLAVMREEVRGGCLSGRLFAESVSIALLAYLERRYSTLKQAPRGAGVLSPAQMRAIDGFVRENVTECVSISDLAGLVHMSPSRFYRAFRLSAGETPYRFVMRLRVEGAKEMLSETSLSATQIASIFGFSSQSHFVKVFRQFTGATPRQYRSRI